MLSLLPRDRAAAVIVLLLALCFGGCTSDSSEVLGEAYIGPATVNVRRELAQRNSTVAVLQHGQKVSIIDVHRRFFKIRAPNGAEGWVDSNDLLTVDEMEQIRKERQAAQQLPSEGAATVFEPLNIHIEPSRNSPAFARIPEGGVVQVLAHQIAPKASSASKPRAFALTRPEPLARKRRRERRGNDLLPPKPPPPEPPANWMELSLQHLDTQAGPAEMEGEARQKEAEQKPERPVPMEDWTLVRTKNNETGWVLSRNLFMLIPDEVAQYAEGKRITSYFDLGTVNDEEHGVKHNWLWTTSSAVEPYDFDGWRVFLWNRRHHRYETSYRQRNVQGYFPVRVEPPDPAEPGRRFELITKDEDGKLRRRTYWFDGMRVHLVATEDAASTPSVAPADREMQLQPGKPGWLRREWQSLQERFSFSHR